MAHVLFALRSVSVVWGALAIMVSCLAFPESGRAGLSAEQASGLLLGWIEAVRPDLAGRGCLTTGPARFRNGGYTIAVDAAACPDPAGLTGRWRLDAATAEVFKENAQGKYVIPPQAAAGVPLANAAFLGGRPGLLPAETKIVAFAPIGPDRAYVLWMLAPKAVPHERGEVYTCPEWSRGSYWSGPTRLSLLDTKKGVVRNTLAITDPLEEGDRFDLPYRIPGTGPFAYAVPEGVGPDREGTPDLLRLRDLDGDGAAREFHLASAGNCMLVLYAVFGYDAARDAVRRYPVRLAQVGPGAGGTGETDWCNFWPVKNGADQGRYRWEVDLRGRAGCLERYAIAYDRTAGRFDGRLTLSDCQEESR